MEPSPRYSLFTSIMHWLMALLIIALLVMGWYMAQMPNGDEKYQLMGLHKSLGVLALILICLRVTGRMISKVAARGETLLDAIGRLSHLLLYLMMLVMPLSGIIMSWAGGRTTHVFSLFEIPGASEKIPGLASAAHSVHVTVIYGLGALIVLHIAAFFYHQFVKQDNIFHRISMRP